jgi:hypothetical protein
MFRVGKYSRRKHPVWTLEQVRGNGKKYAIFHKRCTAAYRVLQSPADDERLFSNDKRNLPLYLEN